MLTITGYSDRISVRPGETIKFMVNCEHPTYQADIVRLICADDTPSGPGFKEKLVRTPVSKRRKGRRQVIHAGSYAMVESPAVAGDAWQLHRSGDDLADNARQGRARHRHQVGPA